MRFIKQFLLFIFFFFSLGTFAQKPFALVELFTSEGCSSCPPADENLRRVKAEAEKSGQNIYILAYHVDYWNKLGWKDPYSKFQFTTRQENYSRVLPGKEVYTPQAVVNGEFEFTGSKKEAMDANIQKALQIPAKGSVEIHKDSLKNDSIYVSYSLTESGSDYTLRLVLTEDGLSNKIGKGENSGKTLNHDGVVRTFFSVNSPAKTGNAAISNKAFSGTGKKKLIAFLQHKQNMKIVAVASIGL